MTDPMLPCPRCGETESLSYRLDPRPEAACCDECGLEVTVASASYAVPSQRRRQVVGAWNDLHRNTLGAVPRADH